MENKLRYNLNFIESPKYRKDIDGLRTIAVLSVIVFHSGYLPNGYLGVDIFFVISGFLITGIIYNESRSNAFSVLKFYVRRIRRILPLVLFICIIALIIGCLTMLPDDLENLAQSIIATNIFSNNILQAITTKDYWDVVNDMKPLMHTWSLAIEEQYYLLYPFIFLIFKGNRLKWVLPILIILTIASLLLCVLPFKDHEKFYYLPFRFYELSLGGIMAIFLKNRLIKNRYFSLSIFALLFLILFDLPFIPNDILLILVVVITCLVLASANSSEKLSSWILENKFSIWIGKISFSLYMWHQLILAYTRYIIIQEFDLLSLIIIYISILVLSVMTYHLIEQPFRNKKQMSTRTVLYILTLGTFLVVLASFYLYMHAGVIKNVPELDIDKNNIERNMHAQYNSQIYSYDKPFAESDKLKVLVVGNSFARDWVNILLESKYKDQLDISYIYAFNIEQDKGVDKFYSRASEADIIFFSERSFDRVTNLNVNIEKMWCVGTKNFGVSNGIFYNYQGDDYCLQRTKMEKGCLVKNENLKQGWQDRYIDLIGYVVDKDGQVPVFTDECKFISQDCRHLTKAGAQYYARFIENDPNFLLNLNLFDKK